MPAHTIEGQFAFKMGPQWCEPRMYEWARPEVEDGYGCGFNLQYEGPPPLWRWAFV